MNQVPMMMKITMLVFICLSVGHTHIGVAHHLLDGDENKKIEKVDWNSKRTHLNGRRFVRCAIAKLEALLSLWLDYPRPH